MTNDHPSFLALDEFATGELDVSSGALAPLESVRRHLEGCDQCKAHVGRLDLRGNDLAIPSDVRRRATEPPQPASQRPWLRWAPQLGLTAAAVAGLLIFVVIRDPTSAPSDEATATTTAKGGASADVFIKRGNDVLLWDGRLSVAEDDRLRLAVTSVGHREVAVFSEGSSGGSATFSLLYHGFIDSPGTTVLPKAWRVDAAAESEVLVVVTSEFPISIDNLKRTLKLHGASALANESMWTKRIVLAKKRADQHD